MSEADGEPWITGSNCAFFRPTPLVPGLSRLGRMTLKRRKPGGIWWHQHPEYELHYIADGILEWGLDRQAPILLRPGDIYITRPGQDHSNYDVVIHRSTLYWLGLNPRLPFFDGVDDATRLRWTRLLPEVAGRVLRGDASMRQPFDTLIDETLAPRDESETVARAAMLQVMAGVFRSYAQRDRLEPDPSQRGKLAQAIDLMQSTLAAPLSIGVVADRVGLSRSGLHAEFVSGMGLSPNEFYQHLRMQKAKELLAQWRTLAQVAKTLGFSSTQHLGAVFKRSTGVTPGRWRETIAHGGTGPAPEGPES